MRLDKIDLNLFVVFDAVYRERSVTRVAQQLHLTQPAVSNALNRLRQTFDDQLFLRTPEGMVPTPVADNVVGDVRRALALLGRSVDASTRFDPATSEKRFYLGMNDLAQQLILPALLPLVQRSAPAIGIHCYYQTRQHAAEELKSGGLDVLVDAPQINAREFGHRPLLELPYVVAMKPDHPLAGKPLTMAGYLAAEHLHVSARKKGRGQADVALHSLGEKRNVRLRVQHYLAAAEITRTSELLWTAPEVAARDSGLHVQPVPFPMEPLVWYLYWSKSATDDPASQWLRNNILSAVAACEPV